jgi:micrococcal nuclease
MKRLRRPAITLLIAIFVIVASKGISSLIPPTQNVLSIKITPTPTPFPSQPNGQDEVVVKKVTDGDTIHVLLNNKDTTIRIIGIDTPETVDPRKPVQCYGKAASDRAKELLTGKTVVLVPDPTQDDKDKYGRLLRYVFINGSDDYGLGAIEEGYAHEYTYDVPYKYQTKYKKAEKAAMNAKVGLWADNACVTPTP